MIVLPTRGRPHEIDELIDAMRLAYSASDKLPPVTVYIDDAENPELPDYEMIDWPEGWAIVRHAEHHELTALVNKAFEREPAHRSYTLIGDHFRPLQPFAAELEAAAADWFIAWPCDGTSSDKQPAGAPTFGGKLVRALGWIMLPGTVHCCTDRVWWYLWRELGICKHVERVRFDRTWPLGQGQVPRIFRGRDYNAADFARWKQWEKDLGPATVKRLRELMVADGLSFDESGRLRPVHGCTPFKAGW